MTQVDASGVWDPDPKGEPLRHPRHRGYARYNGAWDANETLVSVFCPSGGAPDGAKCGTSPSVGLCLKKA